MNAVKPEWYAENQRSLMIELGRIQQLLQHYIDSQSDNQQARSSQSSVAASQATRKTVAAPSTALSQLCQLFSLSPFERDLLLFCAGIELDTSFAALCAQSQPTVKHGSLTFNLAGSVLEQCHWGAFTPDAPLRRWQLIDIGEGGTTLMTSPLRIDERILHFLMGISQLDNRLFGLVELVDRPDFLVASHHNLVQEIVATWRQSTNEPLQPIVQICGGETTNKQAISAAACQRLDLSLYKLSSHAIPTNPQDLLPLLRLWEREAILSRSVLLLDWDEVQEADTGRNGAIALMIESVKSPLMVMSRDSRFFPQRSVVTLDVNNPTPDEQLQLWHHALGEQAAHLNGYIEDLVSQFNLSTTAIRAASTQALGRSHEENSSPQSLISDHLWSICRVQARPRLDDLAQRIDQGESWQDLVLPDQQKQILREVAAHVRQRSKVYQQWGFAGKGGRGLGISALFSGISGTGKTMAAGVLAQELRLDLYRIDLSSIVSKYIGETEKNLRRVFDAAESGGVVLLFDEADSLFGKRSEVKDSHDRYANMEVSYLLQRMEVYRGLAILTTNLKEAIDPAFMRRIRFIVRFPFPEFGDRAKIWERIFPANTPTEGLNYKKLAKLNIAGGNIRNIAMNAAFIAADENQPVKMVHLLKAAQGEYFKLERSMTESEIRGWVQEEE